MADAPKASPPRQSVASASLSRSRRPGAHYFANYVGRGITLEMQDRRRAALEDEVLDGHSSEQLVAAEVNKSKVFALAGDPAVSPPYHIASDDRKVREMGALMRTRRRVQELLERADANKDGRVTVAEFSSVIRQMDPNVTPQHIADMAAGVDPAGSGRIDIAAAVGAYARVLATRPSQRSTLGVACPLTWVAETRVPDKRRDVVENTEVKQHYELPGGAPEASSHGVASARLLLASAPPAWRPSLLGSQLTPPIIPPGSGSSAASSPRSTAGGSARGGAQFRGSSSQTRSSQLRAMMVSAAAGGNAGGGQTTPRGSPPRLPPVASAVTRK